jgi:uncharacterized protein with ATP-grasp and redox domains
MLVFSPGSPLNSKDKKLLPLPGPRMKIQTECLPCLLKRILFETELSTKDTKRQTAAMRTACKLLAESYDPEECSAIVATKIHKGVYHVLEDLDPYAELKHISNTVASSLVPKVEALIKSSSDPLRTSMLCSIIGNIMDFGIDGSSAHPRMLEEVFDRLYSEGLGHDDYKKLRILLKQATHVVLFTDNCGEIVFDKILCRELKVFNPALRITAVVKGEPVLSDATRKDADEIRLSEVVDELFTTGCFAVGVDFKKLPSEVTNALKQADIILVKGMANYESFSETTYRPIAYLLRTKCNAIARSMNLPRDISAIKIYE